MHITGISRRSVERGWCGEGGKMEREKKRERESASKGKVK